MFLFKYFTVFLYKSMLVESLSLYLHTSLLRYLSSLNLRRRNRKYKYKINIKWDASNNVGNYSLSWEILSSVRKGKVWYFGLGNTGKVLLPVRERLQNSQMFRCSGGLCWQTQIFWETGWEREIIFIEHLLNARIKVLLILSSYDFHRIIPVMFVIIISILQMWKMRLTNLFMDNRKQIAEPGLECRCASFQVYAPLEDRS